uniref:WWE domain-containing protein n=1 Tax=Macrostomum lignano TaxID=282301 RepID=A0A1I8FQC8_9PLAT
AASASLRGGVGRSVPQAAAAGCRTSCELLAAVSCPLDLWWQAASRQPPQSPPPQPPPPAHIFILAVSLVDIQRLLRAATVQWQWRDEQRSAWWLTRRDANRAIELAYRAAAGGHSEVAIHRRGRRVSHRFGTGRTDRTWTFRPSDETSLFGVKATSSNVFLSRRTWWSPVGSRPPSSPASSDCLPCCPSIQNRQYATNPTRRLVADQGSRQPLWPVQSSSSGASSAAAAGAANRRPRRTASQGGDLAARLVFFLNSLLNPLLDAAGRSPASTLRLAVPAGPHPPGCRSHAIRTAASDSVRLAARARLHAGRPAAGRDIRLAARAVQQLADRLLQLSSLLRRALRVCL